MMPPGLIMHLTENFPVVSYLTPSGLLSVNFEVQKFSDKIFICTTNSIVCAAFLSSLSWKWFFGMQLFVKILQVHTWKIQNKCQLFVLVCAIYFSVSKVSRLQVFMKIISILDKIQNWFSMSLCWGRAYYLTWSLILKILLKIFHWGSQHK